MRWGIKADVVSGDVVREMAERESREERRRHPTEKVANDVKGR